MAKKKTAEESWRLVKGRWVKGSAKKETKKVSQPIPKTKAAPAKLTHDEIVALIEPWRQSHRRTAYTPVLKKGDGQVTDSKYSGMPWLAKNEDWPACKSCERPLQLVLQLNLKDVPKPLAKQFGTGLLQLFYCRHNWSESCQEDRGFEYFGDYVSLCRIVQPKGAGQSSKVPKEKGYLPAKTIVGWKAIEDFPANQEHEDLGLKYDFDDDDDTVTIRCPKHKLKLVADMDASNDICESSGADKLLGWPRWVQESEYQKCPKCKRKMQVLFQVGSNENLAINFGGGIGHIQQCPTHQDVVAFGWACM